MQDGGPFKDKRKSITLVPSILRSFAIFATPLISHWSLSLYLTFKRAAYLLHVALKKDSPEFKYLNFLARTAVVALLSGVKVLKTRADPRGEGDSWSPSMQANDISLLPDSRSFKTNNIRWSPDLLPCKLTISRRSLISFHAGYNDIPQIHDLLPCRLKILMISFHAG